MKHFLMILCLMSAALLSSAQEERKTAVLVAHYGSSDTLALRVLDAITCEIREAFPQWEVREAYISPVVRKRLACVGIHKDSPEEALLKLRAEGCRTVFVQPSVLIEGGEMASLRRDAERLRPFFEELEVGNPLFCTVSDCEEVLGILNAEKQTEEEESVIYVGHGNLLPSTATYAMLDYMLKVHGRMNCHVSTIEGYPDLTSTLTRLREAPSRNVTLVPLLLVCGNHTKQDIAGTWKSELERQGYRVRLRLQGLGELPAIRSLYISRVRAMTEKRARH